MSIRGRKGGSDQERDSTFHVLWAPSVQSSGVNGVSVIIMMQVRGRAKSRGRAQKERRTSAGALITVRYRGKADFSFVFQRIHLAFER